MRSEARLMSLFLSLSPPCVFRSVSIPVRPRESADPVFLLRVWPGSPLSRGRTESVATARTRLQPEHEQHRVVLRHVAQLGRIGDAADLVAGQSGRDRDVLLAVHLVADRVRVDAGAE